MKKAFIFFIAIVLIASFTQFSSCKQNTGDKSFISKDGYLWIIPDDTYNYSINLSNGKTTIKMTNNTSHWVVAAKANIDWILKNHSLYPSIFHVMSDSASPGQVTPSQYTVISNIWNEGYGYNMSFQWETNSCTVVMSEE